MSGFRATERMAGILFWIQLLAAGAWGHCPDNPPPSVTLRNLSAGVSEQTVCYLWFNPPQCVVDTFYQVRLRNELKGKIQTARTAFLAKLDSLSSRLLVDTLWYEGNIVSLDTSVEESLGIAVLAQFKGSIPERRLRYLDTLPYFSGGLSPTTYAGLVDTPFVAFVNDSLYDNPTKLGIGPVDGCFFEPEAYMVIRGRILDKGFETERMPGVSVSLDAFLAEALSAGVPGLTALDSQSVKLRFGLGRTRIRRTNPDRIPAP